VSQEAGFLISLGQTLATMGLYGDGHPARERAFDASYEQLLALTRDHSVVEYSFLGGETIVANRVIPELATWDWAAKLAAAKVERIEVDADVTRESYLRFVDELYRQVAGRCVDTALAQQMVRPPIRFGVLKVKDPGPRGGGEGDQDGGRPSGADAALRRTEVSVSMIEEVAAVGWINQEIQATQRIPMVEVEAVVHSLVATMHAEEQMLVPLLTLKQYDQYTTTHACNVAVLSMGVSERLGFSPAEVRSFGVAGLLHDIGKTAIPHDLLVKPGRYTEEERKVIQRHPVEGARMILERDRGLGLAAVVAYEHHIFLNGEGYPTLMFARACHYASRIVHVCDVYDALCTDRPYRAAWPPQQALAYLHEQAGRELDPEVVHAFSEMIGEALVQRVAVTEEAPVAAPTAAETPLPSARATF
jgi:putative nucleotidyltransferase with HDIG domain